MSNLLPATPYAKDGTSCVVATEYASRQMCQYQYSHNRGGRNRMTIATAVTEGGSSGLWQDGPGIERPQQNFRERDGHSTIAAVRSGRVKNGHIP